MKILITGATGFVGRNLLPRIIENKEIDRVFVLSRSKEKLQSVKDCNNVSLIDMSDNDYKEKVKNADPDIVIHLAAYLTSRDDEASIDALLNSNVSFGTHLLDALRETSIKAFINIGTFAEYLHGDGELNSAYLYSATKTAFRSILDYYSRTIKFKVINVIPYTIYGGVDSQKKVIDYIVESIKSEKPVDMSPGEQILDFIHVSDVCDFIQTLLINVDKLNGHEEFHLGTGKGTSIKEIASMVCELYEKKPNINWGGLQYRPNDVMHAVAPISKNIEKLNWRAKISLYEGLKELRNK